MAYNLTNISSATNLVEVFVETNLLVNGVFAVFILFTLFMVLFMAMKNYDTKAVFLASAFITFIVGVLMWTINLVGFWVITMLVILLVGALIMQVFWRN